MSMSTHVIGFAPPDEKWKKMKAVWDACHNAQISIPSEVSTFFNCEIPDDNGVKIKLETYVWRDGNEQGYELDLAKVPKHVKRIRFYNAW